VPAEDEDSGDRAAGFNPFTGMRSGARRLLNLLTYWKMKHRAGLIGMTGLAPSLHQFREPLPNLRLHLVGHSFGGRLMSAAARGRKSSDPNLSIASMTLLQAAFSHHGFAEDYEGGKDGFFRRVLADHRVEGPILITHTSNDAPNAWAYPLASRLAGDKAAAFLGGKNDLYGSIGRNGAQKTPEATDEELLATDEVYAFAPGVVHNLEASKFIGDHGDVEGLEVGHAIVSAVAAT
jgi:pimeloyl-ACP methyl ester carboxylesterase